MPDNQQNDNQQVVEHHHYYNYPNQNVATANWNELAVAGFMASIVGGCLFGIGSLLAVILSSVALSQIEKRQERGKGLALAGWWIGATLLIIWVIIGAIYAYYWIDDRLIR